MILRIAIATGDRTQAEELANRLVDLSVRGLPQYPELDLDVAFYQDDPRLLLSAFHRLDLAFLSYGFLDRVPRLLGDLYRKNPNCISVPVGQPDGDICRFLALRPAGHLSHGGDQQEIDRLCALCLEELSQGNEVLQLNTRQGSYAVSAASILFCQSDQKYVMITADTGEVYRRLGRLDQLEEELPPWFLRIHQSFLINSRRLVGLDRTDWLVLLDSGHRVPVSRAYHKTVLEHIQKCRLDG